MATAPFFRRNSKNLLVQNRNVREAIADGIIDFIHVLYENFDADLNAKPSCPLEFIRKGSTLLNIVAAPQPPIYSSIQLAAFLHTISDHTSLRYAGMSECMVLTRCTIIKYNLS